MSPPERSTQVAYFFVVEVQVHDPEAYKAYTAETPGMIAKYGGKWVIRGGAVTPVEGGWDPGRIVVVEFPDEAAFRAFYWSDEYQELLKIRFANATSRAFGVEGWSE
jgi:uncharacterized protein (DUF1330 family)